MNRSRLRRLNQVEAQLPPAPPPAAPSPAAEEVGVLAAELAQAFRRQLDNYRDVYKLPHAEAVARVTEHFPDYDQQNLTCPPSDVSWFALESLAERDEARALHRWEEIKEAARQELRSGHRTAASMQGFGGSCWDRARFLAVRSELMDAWRPRNMIEQLLIDQAAQAQTLMFQWSQAMTAWAEVACPSPRKRKGEGDGYEAPRLSDAEALERAAVKVRLCQDVFLRALEALQRQRRQAPVVVRHARQVNVAHGLQVNVAR